ncbi:MAG: HAD-IA family hydrolase [Acutalibacter sp.]|jgi:HAD superfamily hydrolase (TIGR01549 family)
MKEKLYQMLTAGRPGARNRYQQLRREGVPRWRAAPALLLGGGERIEPLPAGGEAAQCLREPPLLLARRLAAFDVVSFDLFDTLLLRGVNRPEAAFSLVGAKLYFPDFQRLRVEAEALARRRKSEAWGTGEVTLREIWEELFRLVSIPLEEGMEAELQVERALCRGNPYFLPVVQALRREGKPLCLLSDMYLPGEFLQELAEKAGFGRFDKVLVSGEEGVSKGDGGLYDRLRREFPPSTRFAHVGDNPHSDGAMAQSRGFAPFFYRNVHTGGAACRTEDLSPVVGSLWQGMVNRRLRCGLGCSRLFEYGYAYGGLFALGYCRFLRRWADDHGVDRLLFLSRDGEVLLQLYRQLYPEDPRPVYAYWSRLAAAKVTAGLFPEDYFRRFLVHRAGQGVSLGKALGSMELTPLLPGLCRALGAEPGTLLTHKNTGPVKDYLRDNWSRILELYEPQRRGAGDYYRSLLQDSAHAAAVDIGWAGSGAWSLDAAVRRLWYIPCQVDGLVAGTNSAHSPERDAAEPLLLSGRMASYLFSQGENRDLWHFHNPRRGDNLFWELLLGGEEGSLRGIYSDGDGGWRMEFGENPHRTQVREIHRGVLAFCREFLELERGLGLTLPISGRDAYGPMLELLRERNAPYRRGLEGLLDEPGIG